MPDWTTTNGMTYPTTDPTGVAGLKLKDNFEILGTRALSSVCCGRLTLETGVPVSTTNQTAKTTLYFTPYKGDEVGLHDGTDWLLHSLTERSVSVPSLKFMPFDVFLYDNSGTLTLETVNWASSQATGTITGATNASPIQITSSTHGLSTGDYVGITGVVGNTAPNDLVWQITVVDANNFTLDDSTGNGTYTSGGNWYQVPTARSSALGTQDGVYTKNADSTRRYLGTCCTTKDADCDDSDTVRFVWNYYNRVARCLSRNVQLSHTYGTAVHRVWNNDPSNRVDIVIGVAEDAVGAVLQNSANYGGQISFGVDSLTGGSTWVSTRVANSATYGISGGSGDLNVSEGLTSGYHFLSILEYGLTASSAFWRYVIFVRFLC